MNLSVLVLLFSAVAYSAVLRDESAFYYDGDVHVMGNLHFKTTETSTPNIRDRDFYVMDKTSVLSVWSKTSETNVIDSKSAFQIGTSVATDGTVNIAANRNVAAAVHMHDAGPPRKGFAIVAVNGALYTLGGYSNILGTYVTEIYKYDTSSKVWSTLPVVGVKPAVRSYHCAVAYNGFIYIFAGGNSETTYLADLWKFDLSTLTWTTLQPSSVGLRDHSCTVHGTSMFVIGGSSSVDSSSNKSFEYSFSAGIWTNRAMAPKGRSLHSAVTYNGCIYVVGGFSVGYATATDVYDVAANTWSTWTDNAPYFYSDAVLIGQYVYAAKSNGSFHTLNLATRVWAVKDAVDAGSYPDFEAQATAVGTSIYFVGSITNSNELYAYETSSYSWTKHSNVMYRAGHTSVGFGDFIYTFGGSNDNYLASKYDDVLAYNVIKNTFTVLNVTGINPSPDSHQCSVVTSDGTVYIVGGRDSGTSIHKFVIAQRHWTEMSNAPVNRSSPSCAFYKNKIYMWGGSGSGNLTAMFAYNIATDLWEYINAVGECPTPRESASAMVDGDIMYLYGGINGSTLTSLHTFDFVSRVWSFVANMSVGGVGSRAVLKNEVIYLFASSINAKPDKIYSYDLSNGTLTAIASVSSARSSASMVLLGNAVVIHGGITNYTVGSIDVFPVTVVTGTYATTWVSAVTSSALIPFNSQVEIAATENKPFGTDITYAVSIDDGSTWKSWVNGSWVDINNQPIAGMSLESLQTSISNYFNSSTSFLTLKIAIYLRTNDSERTPSVSNIRVTVNSTLYKQLRPFVDYEIKMSSMLRNMAIQNLSGYDCSFVIIHT